MSSIKRRVRKVLRNRKSISFDDLDNLLVYFGYDKRNPGGGSSHFTYSKPGEKYIITIPKKKPVKEFYVKRIIEILQLEDWYEENN